MSGELIGKYRVLAKLGQGGMARVLLTMSQGPHGFNKLLVVKELREELAGDPDFLAMFMDEARIAARLNHPNIVQTYEVGNDGDRYFIAMEYLEGQPLNAIFRRVGRKNISLEIHLRIIADVLAGLEHAHKLKDFDGTELQVVHRDVSPQNVFVTYEGQVKLVDFGIAKAAGASSRTQEGMLKGKISYIAPEQARCETVDARSDLFTVGVMLWEAIAGRRMVTREDEMSVLARRMAGQDQSVREIVPDVPEELAAICDKAMAANRDARFQSAREFQDVLERYLAGSDFRVSGKDVGTLVTGAFEDERVRIKTTIEDQVRNADSTRDPINLELVPASLKQTSDSLARVVVPLGRSSETPAASANTQLTQAVPSEQPRSRSMISFLGIGALLAVGALGVVFYVSRGDKTSAAATNAPKEKEAPTAPVAPAPSTAAVESRPAATQAPLPIQTVTGLEQGPTIKVSIKFPKEAKAKFDGVALESNPFEVKVAKDDTMHKLEVEQDGFITSKKHIIFNKDIDLDIELNPSPNAPRTYIPRSKKTADTDDPPPPPPPPVKTATAEPPAPKTTGKVPGVEIDENNPYKKKPK